MIALKILGIALKHKLFCSFLMFLHKFLTFVADHPLRVSGRMENDTVWELKRGDGGFIVVNGHKASRAVMAYDRAQLQQQNTRALGRTDFKMATAQKLMLMEVKKRNILRMPLALQI